MSPDVTRVVAGRQILAEKGSECRTTAMEGPVAFSSCCFSGAPVAGSILIFLRVYWSVITGHDVYLTVRAYLIPDYPLFDTVRVEVMFTDKFLDRVASLEFSYAN